MPATLTVDPATVRQKQKDTTEITATVILENPSPAFFVCELRSADPRKISFGTIIFKQGDLQETGKGLVHWRSIVKNERVRITAFSADAPDQQVSFTVVLKPKTVQEQSEDSNSGTVPPPQ